MATSRDTDLDAIAAQVRRHPPLPQEQVAELLGRAHGAARGDAEAALIEHHLDVALDAALSRADATLDVGDLYQEAAIAVVTAVEEYAARRGAPAGLRAYVRRVVDLHLDAAIAREVAQRESDEAFIHDIRLLEAAEVELRHSLARPATTAELSSLLGWQPERVELVSTMLAEARALNDETLIPFLDDESDPPG